MNIFPLSTLDAFEKFYPKTILRQISILDTKKRKIRKSKGRIVEATFEIEIKNYRYILQIFHFLVQKLGFISNTLWT